MGLKKLIDEYSDRLTPNDHKILTVILEAPVESAYMAIGEVARRAGVHPTSVVRTSQKLGFTGYPALRESLRTRLVENKADRRIKKRLQSMGDDILPALINSEIKALQTLPQQVKQKRIDQAADYLCQAAQVVVIGIGHGTALSDLMARRLNRSGYRAKSLHHIDWEIPENIAAMTRGDLLMCIYTRNTPDNLPGLLSLAHARGIHTLVISDVAGNFLTPKPEVLMAVSRGDEGDSQSLTLPMALCNTLILELSKRDGGRSIASLGRLDELATIFNEPTDT